MAESHPQSLLDALRPRLAAVAGLDADALEAEQIAVLGRKSGALTALLRSLAALPAEERRAVGAAFHRRCAARQVLERLAQPLGIVVTRDLGILVTMNHVLQIRCMTGHREQ